MIPTAYRILFRWSFWCLVSFCGPAITGHAEDKAVLVVRPDDTRIGYSDYVHLEFVASPVDAGAKLARFDRVLDIPGKGYRWDNPGARIRFRTNATSVKVLLYFNELHISTSARNSQGLCLVDGVSKPEWGFRTKATQTRREP